MKRWQITPTPPAEFLADNKELSPLFLQLAYNRGLTSKSAIDSFLYGKIKPEEAWVLRGNDGQSADDLCFYNPFLFKDMVAAVDVIITHLKAGNKIMVYGDYDADGVTSSVILLETLRILQAKVEVYLPDRVSEGYGLNKSALEAAVKNDIKLIITVDNGIRNFEEVAYGKSLGLDIIITDHHVLPEDEKDLPDCLIINPADKRNAYPWPYLAGVGVAFKLISALLDKADLSLSQKRLILEKSLDLVALGTVADMVSLLGENRLLVKKGLEVLNRRQRLGLNELIATAKINNDKNIEAWNIGWQIGPRLNAASRIGHANSAFSLLTTTNKQEAQELAQELSQRNSSRQQITTDISSQVEEQIDADNIPALIVGLAGSDQSWNEGVIGLVAGRVCEKHYRPTLIITRIIEEAELDSNSGGLVSRKESFKGSGRSIEEFNLIEAIEECSQYLDKYGGHPMACGFSVNSEEKLHKFIAKISALAEKSLAGLELLPKISIDAELDIGEISLEFLEQLNEFAPYGQNNPQPKFVSYGLRIDDVMRMGFENQHIKFRLSSGRSNFWALAFNSASQYQGFQVGDLIDLVYYLEINDFNGRREVQLKIIDIRTAESKS